MRAYNVSLIVYSDDATPEEVRETLARAGTICEAHELEVSEVVDVKEVNVTA